MRLFKRSSVASENPIDSRARELYSQRLKQEHRLLGRTFAWLMLIQWIGGIAAALLISPYTWSGPDWDVHIHLYSAIFLGGLLASFPTYLALFHPNNLLTRHLLAVSQILFSSLLIHLTGGRIETHFHVFGSLAFLAFFRDWKILLTATIVTAADHFLRGVIWPQSIYGMSTGVEWRWLEHSAWVIFEDIFLLCAIRNLNREVWSNCQQQVSLEQNYLEVESKVQERTRELHQSESLLRCVIDSSIDCVIQTDQEGRIIEFNPAAELIFGGPRSEAIGRPLCELIADQNVQATYERAFEQYRDQGSADVIGQRTTFLAKKLNDDEFLAEMCLTTSSINGRTVFTCYLRDITEIKEAEEERLRMHRELVDAARQAGIADTATGVLHNVGNVLNSVNVSALTIRESVKRSTVGRVGQVSELIELNRERLPEFMTNDERGKRLPGYLNKLSAQLLGEQENLSGELEALLRNVEHVKSVIATQQSIAKTSGLTELYYIQQLVEDALTMQCSSFANHEIRIEREYDDLPEIVIDKQKALQILVNLIKNGKEAIKARKSDKRILTITIRQLDADFCEIAITDSGIGIDRDQLKRIFAHGFTTKQTGHGFGLHSCANFAREMGGDLTVESEGLNLGATFRLRLPIITSENPLEKDRDNQLVLT